MGICVHGYKGLMFVSSSWGYVYMATRDRTERTASPSGRDLIEMLFFMTKCDFMILVLIKASGLKKNSKFKSCTPLQAAGFAYM
jgi:hypothetical protein